MYYAEYAVAARIHYESCKVLFENCVKSDALSEGCPKDILYRIYYLCGHIIECAAVYLIYHHFKWEYNPKYLNWKGNSEHIHVHYNKRFTRDSHIDFYQIHIDDERRLISKNGTREFGYASEEDDEGDFYNIQKHEFQKYIKGIICVQCPQDVPYFRQECCEDSRLKKAIDLLDSWTPDLRYYYEGRSSGHYSKNINSITTMPTVTAESVRQLLCICGEIIDKLPSGKQI